MELSGSFNEETNKRTLYWGVGRAKGTNKNDKACRAQALLDATTAPWPEGQGE